MMIILHMCTAGLLFAREGMFQLIQMYHKCIHWEIVS